MATAAVPSHERPIFVVLPDASAIASALGAVLASEDVRAYALPAVWDLDFGGVDPIAGLGLRRLDLENLPRAVEWSLRIATKAALEAHVARSWAELPESVREWFLKRSALATFAAILKVGRPARAFPPPLGFVEERIRASRFEAAYRLAHAAAEGDSRAAPPEEASLVFYPFDPRGTTARAEAGLSPSGPEALVEAFAYEAGRARHRAFLERVARARGWRVVDPSEP